MATFEFAARCLGSIALASVVFCASASELPAPPAGLAALAKPARMPDFNLAKPAGGTLRADEFRGKVVIARFWATWCDTCVGEMPAVQRAYDEYQKSGVAVLAISIDGEGAKAVKPFLAEHHYTLPTPLDKDMHVARAVGVRVAPWTVVIDRSGAVVAGGYGAIDLLSPAFRTYVNALAARPPG